MSIAARIQALGGAPDLRLGLVDYRDRGDAYVTHAVDFTDDFAAFQGAINSRPTAAGMSRRP